MIKFLHCADLHLGAWKEEKLQRLSEKSFDFLINTAIQHKVDFVLISGDLFNTPIPRIEVIKKVVEGLKELKKNNIKVFCIPGSHDFSATGKTMLNVLESAELCELTNKIDENTLQGNSFIINDKKIFIGGLAGKPGQLEVDDFKLVQIKNLNNYDLKIFMFHTSIVELFPLFGGINKDMLPKDFDYYAAGHVHNYTVENLNQAPIVFPSSLFAVNYDELWNYDSGVIIGEYENEIKLKRIENRIIDIEKILIEGKFDSQELNSKLIKEISSRNIKDKIVLIKIKGLLKKGSYMANIDFKKIMEIAYNRGAYFVMKNTRNLEREEYESIAVEIKSENEVVSDLVNENYKIVPFGNNEEEKKEILHKIIEVLSNEKNPDETNDQYEKRIIDEVIKNLEQYIML